MTLMDLLGGKTPRTRTPAHDHSTDVDVDADAPGHAAPESDEHGLAGLAAQRLDQQPDHAMTPRRTAARPRDPDEGTAEDSGGLDDLYDAGIERGDVDALFDDPETTATRRTTVAAPSTGWPVDPTAGYHDDPDTPDYNPYRDPDDDVDAHDGHSDHPEHTDAHTDGLPAGCGSDGGGSGGAGGSGHAAPSRTKCRRRSKEASKPEGEEKPPRVYVARAELTLAMDDDQPLRHVPLRPDPLTPFARAMSDVREDLGETAEIHLDMLPVTPGQRRHRRRKSAAAARRSARHGSGGGGVRQVLLGNGGLQSALTGAPGGRTAGGQRRAQPLGPAGSLAVVEGRVSDRATADKLLSPDPMFTVQVLVRVRSEIPGRAEAHLHAILAGFEQFTGGNHWRVAGRNLGLWHIGADSWSRRGEFDHRADTGLFRPRAAKGRDRTGRWRRTRGQGAWVTATEIAGLLKPPTMHCAASNVLRSGGVIPPPPLGLPTYTGQRELMPLGKVRAERGMRPVGVKIDETFFTLFSGRSRFGKTEASMGRFLTLVRSGHGGLYLDPHRDALEKMKPYLVDVADRVLEIDLSPRGMDATQAGWNLFSMEGLTRSDIEARVSAIVDSFSSALGWGEINNRALSVLTMASQSLCELALLLPPDLAPTLFQLTTVLANEQWRLAALPHLSAQTRDYWENRFARLAGEAIMPVTNLVDRLRASNAVAALFGSSRSTYNVRAAMDKGLIVLACPAGIGDKDRLIGNFFIFDLLRAGLSRRDTAPDHRRPFHAFVDEMQTIDGASSGNLAAILEQIGKFGVRLHGMVQQPGRLTKTTLGAFLTNRSHLFSTAVMKDSAKVLAEEWRQAVTPGTVQGLARYTHLANVTLDGEVTLPFLVHGFEVPELLGGRPDVYPEPLLGDHYRPDDVHLLDAAIDANLARRPVRETLDDLDTLDDRIAAWLASSHGHRPPPGGPGRPGRQRTSAAAAAVDAGASGGFPVSVRRPTPATVKTKSPAVASGMGKPSKTKTAAATTGAPAATISREASGGKGRRGGLHVVPDLPPPAPPGPGGDVPPPQPDSGGGPAGAADHLGTRATYRGQQ